MWRYFDILKWAVGGVLAVIVLGVVWFVAAVLQYMWLSWPSG